MTPSTVAVRAIGCKAHAALERSGGALVALAEFADAPYARADGEIVWIGTGDVAMHPRAVVLQDAWFPLAAAPRLAGAAIPWRPAPLAIDAAGAQSMRDGCAALHRDLDAIGEPQGFAAMLVGRAPPFPFDGAAPRVHLLARALRHADVDAAYAAALPLLGLGPGLTPSGDDLVGAALFARRTIAYPPADATAWQRLAWRLTEAAQTRSHAIAAALFRDLAEGESYAPLHELAAILARAAGREERRAAARAVVAIGHSSGWEMLAGFIMGITGTLMPRRDDRNPG